MASRRLRVRGRMFSSLQMPFSEMSDATVVQLSLRRVTDKPEESGLVIQGLVCEV